MTTISELLVPTFLPWVRIEHVRGDKDGRNRYELDSKAPPSVVAQAIVLTASCCRCGADMSPFRQRAGGGNMRAPSKTTNIYLAVACPHDVNKGCSKGPAASAEYIRIEALVRGCAPPPSSPVQGRLI